MAIFHYQAFNEKGKSVKGVIDAEGSRSAKASLKAKGLYVTEISEGTKKKEKTAGSSSIVLNRKPRVGVNQLAVITRQFATLVAAGMPLIDSLKALGEQIEQTYLRSVISEISTTVNEGSTLANALTKHPEVFPPLYINMVSSGESSGSLELVLTRLADLLESQALLKRKVISALTYPALMLVLCLGVILLLLAYVVPQITTIFEDQGATLPLPTRIIIAMSDFLQLYWWALLAGGVVGIFSFLRYIKTKKGREWFDTFLLKLPVIGNLRLKIATSRLARNLALMLASGVELLSAMSLAQNILGNIPLEKAIASAKEGVREGKSLAKELNTSGYFPKLLIHMIAIGEKTGQMESMLSRAAEAYEAEVDSVIAGFTSILEPLLIIFLAVVVGAILASVMLPMMEMTSLVRS